MNSQNNLKHNFECIRCGKCCLSLTEHGRFCVPLSKEDAKIIRNIPLYKDLKKQGKINIIKGEYDPYYPYDMVAKGICPFYDKEKKECRIYFEHRPTICMNFECSK